MTPTPQIPYVVPDSSASSAAPTEHRQTPPDAGSAVAIDRTQPPGAYLQALSQIPLAGYPGRRARRYQLFGLIEIGLSAYRRPPAPILSPAGIAAR